MYTEDEIITHFDFNAVENQIRRLRNQISLDGYDIPLYVRHSWVRKDFLLYTYLNNIEDGIESLRNAYYEPKGWAKKKIWTANMPFSYLDINRWLNNLNLMEEELNKYTDILKFNDNVYFSDNTIFG